MAISPEQKLWTHVIGQAAMDAFRDQNKKRRYANSATQDHEDAVRFLESRRDLNIISDRAGIDPDYVRRLYNDCKKGKLSVKGFLQKIKVDFNALGAIAFLLLASGCTQAPAPVGRIVISDVKACMAEYEPEGFIGTQPEYDAGCHQFAAVRF